MAPTTNILYLGDSENDSLHLEAAVSIGIRSDSRLKAKLDCKYNIQFNKLPIFIKNLLSISSIVGARSSAYLLILGNPRLIFSMQLEYQTFHRIILWLLQSCGELLL
jgi:hypothetical protein